MNDKYFEQVRESIRCIAEEKPNTKIVVMTECKTEEQVGFIVQCAREYGLAVSVESLSAKLAAQLEVADSTLVAAAMDMRKQVENSRTKEAVIDDGFLWRDEREQMKWRMRHQGFIKRYRKKGSRY